MKKIIGTMALIVWLCSSLVSVHAYELHPISLTLEEMGRNSSGVFRLQNTTERPLTFEISAARRVLKDGYYDELEDADEDFIIMPPQAYIEPGDFQVFRVRYLGNKVLDQAAGYRIIFYQLPVDLAPVEGSGVQFVMHIHAPVFVVPRGTVAEIYSEIDYTDLHNETRFEADFFDRDNPYGVIVLTNHGNGMQDLSRGQLQVEFENGESRTLTWREFSPAVFVRHILPGGESRIPVEGLQLGIESRAVSAQFISS
ncbi:hypothetical protein CWE12_10505 [Aliidiomarina sedimenti]|uniref:Pili assembly chaperone N-terminal domain-containing protein n=1 Tax=Aliidiomarina sedimenti TaxID=1933879 RepID=A0ABY0BYR0_9GAMM|nr:fimbria/pilus periplasmic chaperone [Aliidiomarina sedimenti]RUO29400.1 hypothetical protein CWE12_10505 [Aliidiomarina sedimenti]